MKFLKFALIFILIEYTVSGCILRPLPRYYTKKDGVLPAFIDDPSYTRGSVESEQLKSHSLKVTSGKDFKKKMSYEIEQFLGVPYVWGGNTKYGVDCSGFVMNMYQNSINLKLPHKASLQFKLGKSIRKKDLIFGDLVFFKNTYQWGISHVGIYMTNGNFAHASNGKGKVIFSNLFETYYGKHYAGARRLISN